MHGGKDDERRMRAAGFGNREKVGFDGGSGKRGTP